MNIITKLYGCRRTFISLLSLTALIVATTPFALAADRSYAVELVVTEGNKSVETDADIIFKESTFLVVPDKSAFASQAKEFAYADLKRADYSYAKKPMLSGGGAVATALLVGFIFALPFLFIKKKKHWMTVQTDKDFAVLKLGDRNHRQIVAELETKGVNVETVLEEKKK